MMLKKLFITFILIVIVRHDSFASKMDLIVNNYPKRMICQKALIKAADSLIGPNKHKLYVSRKSTHLTDQPRIHGVVFYKDATSLISFQAAMDDHQQCHILTEKSFTLNELCIQVRNSPLFSKWKFQEIIDNKYFVLINNKPKIQQNAFLINNIFNNQSRCLIKVSQDIQ